MASKKLNQLRNSFGTLSSAKFPANAERAHDEGTNRAETGTISGHVKRAHYKGTVARGYQKVQKWIFPAFCLGVTKGFFSELRLELTLRDTIPGLEVLLS